MIRKLFGGCSCGAVWHEAREANVLKRKRSLTNFVCVDRNSGIGQVFAGTGRQVNTKPMREFHASCVKFLRLSRGQRSPNFEFPREIANSEVWHDSSKRPAIENRPSGIRVLFDGPRRNALIAMPHRQAFGPPRCNRNQLVRQREQQCCRQPDHRLEDLSIRTDQCTGRPDKCGRRRSRKGAQPCVKKRRRSCRVGIS